MTKKKAMMECGKMPEDWNDVGRACYRGLLKEVGLGGLQMS